MKQKLLDLLDVYYTDESDEEIKRDLSRRGKIDQKKLIEIIWLFVKEFEELKEAIELLSKKQVVKQKVKQETKQVVKKVSK